MDDSKVKRMFESIAFSYDFQNSFLSLGQDIAWRRTLARSVQVPREAMVLDLATGTAELAMEICTHHPGVRVVGLDFSPRMLAIGQRKVRSKGLAGRIGLNLGDARRLPFKTECFDGATMAFGIRNIQERKEVLGEIRRVLKEGARLWIMEFDCPDQPVLGTLYRFYFDRIMPPVGNWLSRTDYAYSYLARSVHGFPTEKEFLQEIADDALDRALTIKRLYPYAHLIYISPPSFEELVNRLRQRNTESETDFLKRIERAKMELSLKDQFDYIIENEELVTAINEAKSLVKKILKEN